MRTQTDTTVDRRRGQVAASYKTQGDWVATPPASRALPSFLHDCHPDLIAGKADDQVVIEVKPSRALKGANDLKELADRVTAERGWRLELMAPRTADEDALVPTSHWLGRMLRPPSPGTDTSHHCVYLGEVLDCLIRGVALINNIRVRDKTMLRIARQLVFVGVLGQNLLDRIEDTLDRRDHLMHGLPVSRSAAEQAAEIEKLCRDLHAQAQHSED